MLRSGRGWAGVDPAGPGAGKAGLGAGLAVQGLGTWAMLRLRAWVVLAWLGLGKGMAWLGLGLAQLELKKELGFVWLGWGRGWLAKAEEAVGTRGSEEQTNMTWAGSSWLGLPVLGRQGMLCLAKELAGLGHGQAKEGWGLAGYTVSY
ncbi:hypothetical protein BY996DRAFT_6443225 [Phakopsora pachyrhizi]|nr:hypothetical protein BY996DRAFT_6443225 [Phakopsora pachyrhizi]